MAVESKPLFHPEVIRQQVRAFNLPESVADWQPKLQHWAELIASGRADDFKETTLLPDFLTDFFCGVLGYTGPADSANTFTFSRERHVEVDGKVADAVLGRFSKGKEQFVAVLEGKGARDPLERPFAGRRMSAVDQAYRYAINLPCDWLNPKPVWQNFRGLFRAIDEGNAGLDIPAYNGGLFAADPALDALQVPDDVCAHFKALGDYDYRPARQVADEDENTKVRSVIDVDILGHIFEQSITDLERLRLSLEGGAAPKGASPSPPREERAGERRPLSPSAAASSQPLAALPVVDDEQAERRRKREGAVYTPAFITRYIVEQALGSVLKQRFEALHRQHETEAAGTARKALAEPNAYHLTALNEPIASVREAAESAVRRLIEITANQQQTQRALLDWLRVEYAIEKPSNKLLAATELDSDTWVGEVKRIRGKKQPLTAAGVHALRSEYTRTLEPARALAAETLNLERTLSDLVNQAYGLTPAEIALMWQTAPPRMPIPPPGT